MIYGKPRADVDQNASCSITNSLLGDFSQGRAQVESWNRVPRVAISAGNPNHSPSYWFGAFSWQARTVCCD